MLEKQGRYQLICTAKRHNELVTLNLSKAARTQPLYQAKYRSAQLTCKLQHFRTLVKAGIPRCHSAGPKQWPPVLSGVCVLYVGSGMFGSGNLQAGEFLENLSDVELQANHILPKTARRRHATKLQMLTTTAFI